MLASEEERRQNVPAQLLPILYNYFEVSMTAHNRFFSTTATCLSFFVAILFLGLACGCGDASQSTSQGPAAEEAQKIQAKVKEVHSKKRLP